MLGFTRSRSRNSATPSSYERNNCSYTAGGTGLLHYRPYRGRLRGPAAGVWAIARSGLWMILRRKLFWGLYGLCLMVFLFFFFGQYIMSWLSTNLQENTFRVGSGSVATLKPPGGGSRVGSISRIAALSRRSGRKPQALSGSPMAEFEPWTT